MKARNILLGIVVSVLLTGGFLSVFMPEERPVTIEEGIAAVQSLYNEQCAVRDGAHAEYLRVKERMTDFEKSTVESLFVENRRTLDTCASMIIYAFPDSLGFDVRRRLLLGAIGEMKHSVASLVRIALILMPYEEKRGERSI